jgi:MscS family membrane protein
LTKYLGFAVIIALVGCFEPRLDRNAHPERIGQLKLFSAKAPAWGMHHIDMPQFSDAEEAGIVTWLEEGKIELNPADQAKDFQFVNSLDKLLTTGDADDKVRVRRDYKIDDLSKLIPTQHEIYWGNIAPKIIDSLSGKSKFSACSGNILVVEDKGFFYILDGHHRFAACLVLRRFVGKAEDFKKIFAPFQYYEDRKIYELLSAPESLKFRDVQELKVTAVEGNPQGILRALYEMAKLGHGHFSVSALKETSSGPIAYLKHTMFWENTLLQWIYFGAIILGSLILGKLILLLLKLKAISEDDGKKSFSVYQLILQTVRKYIYSILFLVSLRYSLPLLTIPPAILEKVQAGLVIAVIWLMTIFAARLFSNYMLRWQERLRARPGDSEIAHLFPLLTRTGKLVIYFMGVLFVLNRAGYNIYSAIAGLSVGGFALAMAGREAVGHIFSGISLYIDKVVKEGDYLLLDEIKTWGRVEKVGIRSTTIRTKYNSILIVPNSHLANQPVNNITVGGFKRMFRGRILLAQSTTHAVLTTAMAEMRKLIEAAGNTKDVDVHFMKFDAFGFYVRIQFFVEPYTEYHETVSRANLAILNYLNANNIKVAVDLEKLRENEKRP